jgi:hypothetical protein
MDLLAPLHALAARALANHPAPSAGEASVAAAAVRPLLDDDGTSKIARTGIAIMVVLPSAALLLSAIVAALSAIAGRGLLLRLLGLAVVTRRGLEIGRVAAFGRALLGWSPIIALWTYAAIAGALGRPFDEIFTTYWIVVPAIGCALAGAVWAIVRPDRAWHDLIMRTRIVPR